VTEPTGPLPVPGPPPRQCSAVACTGAAVLQWQRVATAAELAQITLPAGDISARIAVFGCEPHALDLESAARLHLASCTWPAPCTCVADGAAS
jgi:hypothetical protein